jgi:hypothetical protein
MWASAAKPARPPNRTAAWRENSWPNTFHGIPGAAQGVTYPGASTPAFAKLVSAATEARRS